MTRIPDDVAAVIEEIDAFIEAEIRPLEAEDDNSRFFDHRREIARTDFEAGGVPGADWEELLMEASRRADAAGLLRYALPEELGGRGGTNLAMAIIREHLNNMPISDEIQLRKVGHELFTRPSDRALNL